MAVALRAKPGPPQPHGPPSPRRYYWRPPTHRRLRGVDLGEGGPPPHLPRERQRALAVDRCVEPHWERDRARAVWADGNANDVRPCRLKHVIAGVPLKGEGWVRAGESGQLMSSTSGVKPRGLGHASPCPALHWQKDIGKGAASSGLRSGLWGQGHACQSQSTRLIDRRAALTRHCDGSKRSTPRTGAAWAATPRRCTQLACTLLRRPLRTLLAGNPAAPSSQLLVGSSMRHCPRPLPWWRLIG